MSFAIGFNFEIPDIGNSHDVIVTPPDNGYTYRVSGLWVAEGWDFTIEDILIDDVSIVPGCPLESDTFNALPRWDGQPRHVEFDQKWLESIGHRGRISAASPLKMVIRCQRDYAVLPIFRGHVVVVH